MKIEYDKEVDAAYIYIKDFIKDGEAKKTIELDESIILDFDENNKLLGIEIIPTRIKCELLPLEIIKKIK